MEIIVSENQLNEFSLENRAKLFDLMVSKLYPNMSEVYLEDSFKSVYEFWDSEDEKKLLYYKFEDSDMFYVSAQLISDIGYKTKLPFFDYDVINSRDGNELYQFDEVMIIYARKYLGYDVNRDSFHFH